MTVTFGAGVLPHLDYWFDPLSNQTIEVVIGIVSSVGQHLDNPAWKQAGRLLHQGWKEQGLAGLLVADHQTDDRTGLHLGAHMHLFQPRCTCHFSLIHLPRSLTLIPVESTARVQPEPQRSTIGRCCWLGTPGAKTSYNRAPGT